MGSRAQCQAARFHVLFTQQQFGALILLSLIYGGIAFQQPSVFAVCLDIGGEYAGAVLGAMNTASQIGSFVSSVEFGYLVDHYDSYNALFIPMAALLLIGAWLWLKVHPSQALIPRLQAVTTVGMPVDAVAT
jgi:ACS family glucarate transporter-like MFS transporter